MMKCSQKLHGLVFSVQGYDIGMRKPYTSLPIRQKKNTRHKYCSGNNVANSLANILLISCAVYKVIVCAGSKMSFRHISN